MNSSYSQAWDQIFLSPAADARIQAALTQAAAVPPKKRKPAKILAAALAAVLLLTISALAAADFDLSEISQAFRLLWGIEDTDVPTVHHYDTVTEADNARTSDPYHIGQGEIYVRYTDAVQSEHFLTVDLSVSTVTSDQYQDDQFVWRAQIDGTEDYLEAEKASPPTKTLASITLRLIIPQEDIAADELHLTVYGGYESADGTVFDIRRVGIVSMSVPAPDEVIPVPLAEPIVFSNEETGETASITALEIHTGCLVVYTHIDGISQLTENDSAYIVWLNSLAHPLFQAVVTLKNGDTLGLFPHRSLTLPDDTYVEYCSYNGLDDLDISQVASVTISGHTYEIN